MHADQLFLILYRELYYRHVYSRLQPDIDDRFHSYENSCELFNYLLSAFSLARTPSFCVSWHRRFGRWACTASAPGTVVVGYRRRVYLSVPVLLRLALKSEDQD